MKIAMTGVNGFIGSRLAWYLRADNHDVYRIRSDKYDKEELRNDYDCLIHCARSHKNISNDGKELIAEPSEEQWLNEYKTDVYLPYKLTTDVSKKSKLTDVVFISSIYGVNVPTVRPIPLNYVTSKAAEIHLAKNLAHKLAPKTRVNTIILGGVKSDRIAANQTEEFTNKYHKKTLLNKMVDICELVCMVDFLISKNTGTTGHNFFVDGGYCA